MEQTEVAGDGAGEKVKYMLITRVDSASRRWVIDSKAGGVRSRACLCTP